MTEGSSPTAPTLLFIVGPPAVGKMTVGREIAARTGLRLFHNHMAIEPVLRFFDFGSPAFGRLVDGFRQRLVEEVAASDLPGLIFTFVWAFDQPSDQRALEQHARHFRKRGGRVLYLELNASQEARLQRNTGTDRLAEKPSKRDLEASQRQLLDLDTRYRLNSTTEFEGRTDYLRIDNTRLSPEDVSKQAIEHFRLNG
ncbi:AAA family ATPase [Actinomadura sp. LOL_016]|uniref:AAA family ATPase n=1 Tax=unclassified Actinomadura TaxID=2626254 RepID=UPI003A809F7C